MVMPVFWCPLCKSLCPLWLKNNHEGGPNCCVLASGSEGLREAHGGAKRAKHRAKRSPECADP
jgi:hypothetical protein